MTDKDAATNQAHQPQHPQDEPKRPAHMAFHWELTDKGKLPAWYSGAQPAHKAAWDAGCDFSDPRILSTRDGRSVVVGTMSDKQDIDCLSTPRRIINEGGSVRLEPIAEIDSLHTFEASLDPHAGGLFQHHRADIQLNGIQSGTCMLALDNAFELQLKDDTLLMGFVGDYDEGHGRPMRALETGSISSLRLLVDDSSVECFVNGGRQVLSTRWFPVTRTMLLAMNLNCLSAKAFGMADGVDKLYAPLL